MTQIRHVRWYLSAFFKKHGKVVLISMGIGTLFFVLLPGLLSSLTLFKPTTYIGRVGVSSLSQLPRDIQQKISFGLTKSFQNGEIVPALASAYTREENGKSYRFTIHPHVVWQDGKEVVPQDISYAFTDAEIARTQNDILFRIIAKKQDQSTQEPVLPISFLSTVSQPLFRTQDVHGLFRTTHNVIGLGEYKITSLVDQGAGIKELVLDSSNERLVYRFYPTEHDAIVAFKRGEVDKVENLQDTEDLMAADEVKKVKTIHLDQYVGVFFNLNYKVDDSVVFANKQLRQALNYATRKPDASNRVFSPINQLSWAYVKNIADLDLFNQDMQQAASLLNKVDTPTKLTIDLLTTPSYINMAENIKQDWEQLGTLAVSTCKDGSTSPVNNCANKKISVNIHISNFPDTTNFEVLLVGQQIPLDPDQYTLWDSTQQTNITHYKNARVDKLLEDGRRTDDKESRKLIYQEFQQILVNESPVIFLTPVTTYTVSRQVKLF